MSDITRYIAIVHEKGMSIIAPHNTGDYVSYADYLRLTKELAERDKNITMFKSGLQVADDKCIELQCELTKANERNAELSESILKRIDEKKLLLEHESTLTERIQQLESAQAGMVMVPVDAYKWLKELALTSPRNIPDFVSKVIYD